MAKNEQKPTELTKRIVKFRDARDWKQFHNPKDLALSLSLEAAEVMGKCNTICCYSNRLLLRYCRDNLKEQGFHQTFCA